MKRFLLSLALVVSVFICRPGLFAQSEYVHNPHPILTSNYQNPSSRWTTSNWTSNICSGKTWLSGKEPRYEWTPVLDPSDETSSIVGITGVALHPHESTADVPFTHPFGQLDWNYLVLPDEQYRHLLGPRNDNKDKTDAERNIASQQAAGSKLDVSRGLLAVENDRGLCPPEFRVSLFNRVAVFGRWIVDCGHDDYLTEIHPPLLSVYADASPGSDVELKIENLKTRTKIISLPFLVSQEFEGGSLLEQLLKQLALVFAFPLPGISLTDVVKARPIIKKPFSGRHEFSVVVRPPVVPVQAARVRSKHDLYVQYHFTVRSGITINMTAEGPSKEQPDAVRITVVMDERDFKMDQAFLDRTRRDWLVSIADFKRLNEEVYKVYQSLVPVIALADGGKASVFNRGILTDQYDSPEARMSTAYQTAFVRDLTSAPKYVINDLQPYPIYGWISVSWVPSDRSTDGRVRLTTVSVPANQQWFDTGLELGLDEEFSVEASGQWSNSGPPSVGPAGFKNYKYPGTLMPIADLASLIGKVSSSMFPVGSEFIGKSPATGRLYLSINDTPDTFSDNQGTLQVKIFRLRK